jgi:hypothetical protein
MVLGVRFIDSIPGCVPAPSSTFFDSNGFSPEALRWRPASNKQNNENLPGAQPNSKSGVRGVRWDSRCQCWRAVVKHQGKFHERRCATIELAEVWVVAKRNELFTRVKT